MKRVSIAGAACTVTLSLLTYITLDAQAYGQQDRSTWSDARWKAYYQINDDLCSNALNDNNSDWNANPDRAPYVAEAIRRGLTVDACNRKPWRSSPSSTTQAQAPSSTQADDNLQKALNYIFSGDVDAPSMEAPGGKLAMKVTIEDRNNCIVSLTVQNFEQIRTVYYFRKMNPDTAQAFDATPPDCPAGIYCPGRMGSGPKITVEGDDTVVAVSDASNKQGEINRRKIATFPIVGNPDRMIKALQYVFSQCPPEQSKTPF
jgi:hypothetical protein